MALLGNADSDKLLLNLRSGTMIYISFFVRAIERPLEERLKEHMSGKRPPRTTKGGAAEMRQAHVRKVTVRRH